MKRLSWILLLLPLASCSDSRTPHDIEPPRIADVKVQDDRFSFVLETQRGVRQVRTALTSAGLTSSIEDAAGRALFALSVEAAHDGIVLTESTPRDRLRIHQSLTEDTIREHFVYNERELVVAYPRLDPMTMMKSAAHFRRGDHDRLHPALLRAFLDFETFYDDADSLHDNADGHALVAALLSNDLAERLRDEYASKPGIAGSARTAHDKEVSVYCAIVGIGTGLKCLFGGAANPACLFGTYHSIACGIFEIVCSLWWSC